MAQATLLTDDLVRRLISVGQVDILVGLATLNNVETLPRTLHVVQEGLSRQFARARTVVIVADGGSSDGTLDLLNATPLGARDRGLRTRHQIAAPYRGVPGKASAIRLIFTAADLLQARTVAIVDPEAAALAPASVGALLQAVASESCDLAAPVRVRHPLERLLVTQLIRPLVRATFGRHLDDPLLAEFACSGRFAAHCLTEDVWDRSPTREGIEMWLAATALAGRFRTCQTFVEADEAPAPSARARPGLQEMFPPLVGSLFAALDAHAEAWLRDTQPERATVIGPEPPPPTVDPPHAPAGLGGSFAQDVRDLHPVLESILAPDTLSAINAIAEAAGGETPRYPDDAWVATVYDFAAAHHAGVIDRTHIVRALMPLYMGRAAWFVTRHGTSKTDDVAQDLDTLAQQFERSKPYLIERWNRAP